MNENKSSKGSAYNGGPGYPPVHRSAEMQMLREMQMSIFTLP